MTPPPRTGFAERAEIWLVVWVCGGLSITGSLLRLIQNPTGPILFTTPRVLGTVGVEIGLAIAFLPFLRQRGWRMNDSTATPWRYRNMIDGIGLCIMVGFVYWATLYVARAVDPAFIATVVARRFQGRLPLSVVAIVSAINPIFEESFYLGYTFNALRRYSLGLAFAIAFALRVAVHLYQGWYALFAIAPMALIFTFYFMRTNRIWPVIVAHAIQDFVALAALSTHATSQ